MAIVKFSLTEKGKLSLPDTHIEISLLELTKLIRLYCRSQHKVLGIKTITSQSEYDMIYEDPIKKTLYETALKFGGLASIVEFLREEISKPSGTDNNE